MLASGVWRLCDTPRRKSSLASSSSTRRRFWSSTRAIQLGVADRRRDLDREQLEQVLVGALPAPRRGQVAHDDAELLARGDEVRPDRDRVARDDLLGRDLARIDEQQLAVDHPERDPRLRPPPGAAMASGRLVEAVASSATTIWRSSRFRRARSRARRLWLSARRLNSSSPGSSRRAQVAGGDLVHRAGDRAQRRRRGRRRAAAASSTANDDRDRDREQQHAREASCRSPASPVTSRHDDAERRRRAGPRRRSGRA